MPPVAWQTACKPVARASESRCEQEPEQMRFNRNFLECQELHLSNRDRRNRSASAADVAEQNHQQCQTNKSAYSKPTVLSTKTIFISHAQHHSPPQACASHLKVFCGSLITFFRLAIHVAGLHLQQAAGASCQNLANRHFAIDSWHKKQAMKLLMLRDEFTHPN